ncbi:hypothetical protein CLI72_00200 [Porphyromonas gingivalis]|nr:hypothetical protein CS545_03235 [Porphyromonas gingivalis]ATR93915.1 hypothetical protein CS546_02065 [Porphyromonas gingivalis]ATR97077.1 hypothetical protein CS548_08450 [Porphyromonas gingivalis]ATS07808.1 hypothetical protein CS388_01340 [Porphyromonas gingivalis]PDP78540.1 hypothetical protein CLI73_08695 [Porphyromonas gingivalis]
MHPQGGTLVPFRGEYIGAALLTTAATFSGRIHSGAIGYLSPKNFLKTPSKIQRDHKRVAVNTITHSKIMRQKSFQQRRRVWDDSK